MSLEQAMPWLFLGLGVTVGIFLIKKISDILSQGRQNEIKEIDLTKREIEISNKSLSIDDLVTKANKRNGSNSGSDH